MPHQHHTCLARSGSVSRSFINGLRAAHWVRPRAVQVASIAAERHPYGERRDWVGSDDSPTRAPKLPIGLHLCLFRAEVLLKAPAKGAILVVAAR